MTHRLPIPGSDEGAWGGILNDFLAAEHNVDGSLKLRTDGTLSQVATSGHYADLTGKPSIPTQASDISAVATSQMGAANGVATLDGTGKLSSAQLPDNSGQYVAKDTLYIVPEDHGAKGDTKTVGDAAMANGSTVLSSASAAFVAGDAGKVISVLGAGQYGHSLAATISSVTNATTATLSVPAQTAVSGAGATWGTDDTAALATAVSVCPAGGYLRLRSRYTLTAPLHIPANVNVLGGDAPLYGNLATEKPALVPAAAFSGTAVIMADDTNNGIVHFAGVLIDGTNLGFDGSVKGMSLPGNSNAAIWRVERVMVAHFPGGCIQLGTPGGVARVAVFTDVTAFYAVPGSDAWEINTYDSHFTRCLGFGSTNGWHIYHASNSTFLACRAEHNATGYFLDAPSIASSIIFDGCSSDQNDNDGFTVSNATWGFYKYGGAIKLNSCAFNRDGNNSGAGSTTYSGIRLSGSVVPVLIEGTTVGAGRGDTAGYGPAYGLLATGNTFVSVNGGSFTGTTAPVNDAGGNTQLVVSPTVLQGTRSISGDTGSFQASPGFLPAGLGLSLQGFEPYPRLLGSTQSANVNRGIAVLVTGVAAATCTVSSFHVTPKVVPSGATLCRLGLYSVSGTTATLVARTAASGSLFGSSYSTTNTAMDTTGGYPASYTVTAGSTYAVALVVVGGSVDPQYFGLAAWGGHAGLSPLLTSSFSSQTDLAASYTLDSGATWGADLPWIGLT